MKRGFFFVFSFDEFTRFVKKKKTRKLQVNGERREGIIGSRTVKDNYFTIICHRVTDHVLSEQTLQRIRFTRFVRHSLKRMCFFFRLVVFVAAAGVGGGYTSRRRQSSGRRPCALALAASVPRTDFAIFGATTSGQFVFGHVRRRSDAGPSYTACRNARRVFLREISLLLPLQTDFR